MVWLFLNCGFNPQSPKMDEWKVKTNIVSLVHIPRFWGAWPSKGPGPGGAFVGGTCQFQAPEAELLALRRPSDSMDVVDAVDERRAGGWMVLHGAASFSNGEPSISELECKGRWGYLVMFRPHACLKIVCSIFVPQLGTIELNPLPIRPTLWALCAVVAAAAIFRCCRVHLRLKKVACDLVWRSQPDGASALVIWVRIPQDNGDNICGRGHVDL